ncbi:hypothetical protein B0T17DRAFT_612196 [Bombardia bombarda]|uniref:Uncharacterized protein n=1 Tax=Bombardia bombarda TaxID=252184 RepID=A0AA39XL47_9PEZI|nr:hypothetical protein B0T17DRAFT_612196 [Bombardia bombarda]
MLPRDANTKSYHLALKFKNIAVLIAESGDGYRRLTDAISESVKIAALAKVKERFEGGSLFKESEGDQNAHYSVQGETATGRKVKGGHIPEDTSKQTQAG